MVLVVPMRVSGQTAARPMAEAADAPAVIGEPLRGEVRALPTPSAAVVDAASLGHSLTVIPETPRTPAPLPSRIEIPASGFESPARTVSASRKPVAKSGHAARRGMHTVRKGDTLYRIATHYGVSVEALRNENRIGRKGSIRIGQQLAVPRAAGR
jgi:LysM repeat protein